jgi:hypothetical protein
VPALQTSRSPSPSISTRDWDAVQTPSKTHMSDCGQQPWSRVLVAHTPVEQSLFSRFSSSSSPQQVFAPVGMS